MLVLYYSVSNHEVSHAASGARQSFSHRDWLYEIKHDGFPALAFIKDGNCRFVSRNGNGFNALAHWRWRLFVISARWG